MCLNWLVVVILPLIIFLNWRRRLRAAVLPNLHTKYVLITGCDSGFGHHLAIHLDSLGLHVVATCLTEEGCATLKEKGSQRMTVLRMDVTDRNSILTVKEEVEKLLPSNEGLWGLVNNAGIFNSYVSLWAQPEDYRTSMDVNLHGMVEMVHQFLPLIRKAQGRIVNVSSAGGRYCSFGGPYIASKFAVEAFSDGLRRCLSEEGVKVQIVEPGCFPTNIFNKENLSKILENQWEKLSPEDKIFYGDELKNEKLQTLNNLTGNLFIRMNRVEHVVESMTHALTSCYPRIRYVVGWDAKLIYIPLSILPDFVGDWGSELLNN